MVQGYAVVDVVTTGAQFGVDRIIEIAVVHVDAEGRTTGMWDTLVNPGIDRGAVQIRCIRASDVRLAPSFAQLAAELCELLEGRVLVAHDADVPLRALASEFQRAGIAVPDFGGIRLCTMQLARKFLPGRDRTLAECAASLGLDLSNAYRASAYAFVAAQSLDAYIRLDPNAALWAETRARADAARWPSLGPSGFSWTPRPHDKARCVVG